MNMTADELCELLRRKGVDEEDCALFRSKVSWVKGRRNYVCTHMHAYQGTR